MDSTFNPPSAVSSAEQPLQTVINGVGAFSKSLEGVSMWQILLTLLVVSITYDQGTRIFDLSRLCEKKKKSQC
jgi:C-22 sterol desaturase